MSGERRHSRTCGEIGYCNGCAPTPLPSEVAETTAGEREVCAQSHDGHPCGVCDPTGPDAGEVEALFDCSCGHGIDEHNGLGCYARLSYKPLVTCECPLTDDRTHGELLAPRLAALLDRVRREEGERIAQAIEADVDRMRSTGGGIYTADFAAGAQYTTRIARAASVGRGEGL